MAQLFFRALPEALSCGMTPEQFWHGEPWLYAAYAEAARRLRERSEWERWQMGCYVMDAILRSSPALNPLEPGAPDQWMDAPYGHGQQAGTPEDGTEGGASSEADEEAQHLMIADMLMHGRR